MDTYEFAEPGVDLANGDRPRPGANQTGAGSPISQQGAREATSLPDSRSPLRSGLRNRALSTAIRKREVGVPTYSVPEAAALLSISQEYLYRLIQAGGFPAVHMRIGGRQGRYVVPAKAIEQLLDDSRDVASCIDANEWTARWLGQQVRMSDGVQ